MDSYYNQVEESWDLLVRVDSGSNVTGMLKVRQSKQQAGASWQGVLSVAEQH